MGERKHFQFNSWKKVADTASTLLETDSENVTNG